MTLETETGIRQQLLAAHESQSETDVTAVLQLLTRALRAATPTQPMPTELLILCCEEAIARNMWVEARHCVLGFSQQDETGRSHVMTATRTLEARGLYCEALVRQHFMPTRLAAAERVDWQQGCIAVLMRGLAIAIEEWPHESWVLVEGTTKLWGLVEPLYRQGAFDAIVDVVAFVVALHERLMIGGGMTHVQWSVRYVFCLRGTGHLAEAVGQLNAAIDTAAHASKERLYVQLLRTQVLLLAELETTTGKAKLDGGKLSATVSSLAATTTSISAAAAAFGAGQAAALATPTATVQHAVHLTQLLLCGVSGSRDEARADLLAVHDRLHAILTDDADETRAAVAASGGVRETAAPVRTGRGKGGKVIVNEFVLHSTEVMEEVLSDVLLCLAFCGVDAGATGGGATAFDTSVARLLRSSNARSRTFAQYAHLVRQARCDDALLREAGAYADTSYVTPRTVHGVLGLLRQVEQAMNGARYVKDAGERAYALQVGAVLLWNWSLPLLQVAWRQDNSRVALCGTLQRLVAELQACPTPCVATLQARAEYEYAACEFALDGVATARAVLERIMARGCDSVGLTEPVQWLLYRISLHDGVPVDRVAGQRAGVHQALHDLEQAGRGGAAAKRTTLLRSAFHALPSLDSAATQTARQSMSTTPADDATAPPDELRGCFALRTYHALLQACMREPVPALLPIARSVAEALCNYALTVEPEAMRLLQQRQPGFALRTAQSLVDLAQIYIRDAPSPSPLDLGDAPGTTTAEARVRKSGGHGAEARRGEITTTAVPTSTTGGGTVTAVATSDDVRRRVVTALHQAVALCGPLQAVPSAASAATTTVLNACHVYLNWRASHFARAEFDSATITELAALHDALAGSQVDYNVESRLACDLTLLYVAALVHEFVSGKTGELAATVAASASFDEWLRSVSLCPRGEAGNALLRRAYEVSSELLRRIALPSRKASLCVFHATLSRLAEVKEEGFVHPQEQLLFLLGRLAAPTPSPSEKRAVLQRQVLETLRRDPAVELCGRVLLWAEALEERRVAHEVCLLAEMLYAEGKLGWGSVTGGDASGNPAPAAAAHGNGATKKNSNAQHAATTAVTKTAVTFPPPTPTDWMWYSVVLCRHARLLRTQCTESDSHRTLGANILTLCTNASVAALHAPPGMQASLLQDALLLYDSVVRQLCQMSCPISVLRPSLQRMLSDYMLDHVLGQSAGDAKQGAARTAVQRARLAATLTTGTSDAATAAAASTATVLTRRERRLRARVVGSLCKLALRCAMQSGAVHEGLKTLARILPRLPATQRRSLRQLELHCHCQLRVSPDELTRLMRGEEDEEVQAQAWVSLARRQPPRGSAAQAMALWERALHIVEARPLAKALCLLQMAEYLLQRSGGGSYGHGAAGTSVKQGGSYGVETPTMPITETVDAGTATMTTALQRARAEDDATRALLTAFDIIEEVAEAVLPGAAVVAATDAAGATLGANSERLSPSRRAEVVHSAAETSSRPHTRSSRHAVTSATSHSQRWRKTDGDAALQCILLGLRVSVLLFLTRPATQVTDGGLSGDVADERRNWALHALRHLRRLWLLCVTKLNARRGEHDVVLVGPPATLAEWRALTPDAVAQMGTALRAVTVSADRRCCDEALQSMLLLLGDYLLDEAHADLACYALYHWLHLDACWRHGADDVRARVVRHVTSMYMELTEAGVVQDKARSAPGMSTPAVLMEGEKGGDTTYSARDWAVVRRRLASTPVAMAVAVGGDANGETGNEEDAAAIVDFIPTHAALAELLRRETELLEWLTWTPTATLVSRLELLCSCAKRRGDWDGYARCVVLHARHMTRVGQYVTARKLLSLLQLRQPREGVAGPERDAGMPLCSLSATVWLQWCMAHAQLLLAQDKITELACFASSVRAGLDARRVRAKATAVSSESGAGVSYITALQDTLDEALLILLTPVLDATASSCLGFDALHGVAELRAVRTLCESCIARLLGSESEAPWPARYVALLTRHTLHACASSWCGGEGAQHGEDASHTTDALMRARMAEADEVAAVRRAIESVAAADAKRDSLTGQAANLAGVKAQLLRLEAENALERLDIGRAVLQAYRSLTLEQLSLDVAGGPSTLAPYVLRFMRDPTSMACINDATDGAVNEVLQEWTATSAQAAQEMTNAFSHFHLPLNTVQGLCRHHARTALLDALRVFQLDSPAAEAGMVRSLAHLAVLRAWAKTEVRCVLECSAAAHTDGDATEMESQAASPIARRVSRLLAHRWALCPVTTVDKQPTRGRGVGQGESRARSRRGEGASAATASAGSHGEDHKPTHSTTLAAVTPSSPTELTGQARVIAETLLRLAQSSERVFQYGAVARDFLALAQLYVLWRRPRSAAWAVERAQAARLHGLLLDACCSLGMSGGEWAAWGRLRAMMCEKPALVATAVYDKARDELLTASPMVQRLQVCQRDWPPDPEARPLSGTTTAVAAAAAATTMDALVLTMLYEEEEQQQQDVSGSAGKRACSVDGGHVLLALRHPDGVVDCRRVPLAASKLAEYVTGYASVQASRTATLLRESAAGGLKGSGAIATAANGGGGGGSGRACNRDSTGSQPGQDDSLRIYLAQLDELVVSLLHDFDDTLRFLGAKYPLFLCLDAALQPLPLEHVAFFASGFSSVQRELSVLTVHAKLQQRTSKAPAGSLFVIDPYDDDATAMETIFGPESSSASSPQTSQKGAAGASKGGANLVVRASGQPAVPPQGYIHWALEQPQYGTALFELCGSLGAVLAPQAIATLHLSHLQTVLVVADGVSEAAVRREQKREVAMGVAARLLTRPWLQPLLLLARGVRQVGVTAFVSAPEANARLCKRLVPLLANGRALLEACGGGGPGGTKTAKAKKELVTFYGMYTVPPKK